MKIFTLVAVLCSTVLMTYSVMGQENWPKSATTSEGTLLKLYQWQPESFADNTLKAHAAISVLEKGKTDPVFGVAWIKATTATNGQQVEVKSIYITDIKLPGESDHDKLESLANAMEDNVSSWNISFATSELQTSLDLNKQQTNLAGQINNTPPKVIYSNVPSILVLIDGAPKLQHNNDWGVDAVVNTPFVLVKNNDDRYYLYGGKHWYSANAATGPYNMVTNVPSNLEKIEGIVRDANKNNSNQGQETDANTIYNIIVSTEPAELIQSRGEANFSAIQGTGLLYVANSENDIFMDINSQQYYVLLSGRWYHSKTLSGQWQYVAADQLPEDFAKIPKGSPKDNVLASVAGTEQANDAVENAQVPQTAKVERSKVHADVNYDGDPEFEPIDGTDMYYAVNSPVSVIRWHGRYYCVDDGIWFESYSAIGPWGVCINRPYAVALIPPRYPVYYMKYVDIYDVTPDYVYMGYTPGYLNAYVYGPTVVYGTGYYYHPWYRRYYYPRPCTWGFGVRYNPWFGWGFGVGFDYGWFHVGIGFGDYWGGYWGCGGWWGPRVYRPAYYGSPYYYRGGYYGYNSYNVYRTSRVSVVNNYYINNNIYRGRQGVVTRDYPRFPGPDRGGRLGRTEFAGNGNRFEGNNPGGGRYGNNFNNGRNFPAPGMNGGRQATGNPAGGNGRQWNAPGNSPRDRVVVTPQGNDRFEPTRNFNQRSNTAVRDNPNRGFEQNNGFRSIPEQPRRNIDAPSNNGGFSRGRAQSNGGFTPAPRMPERRESNSGGGGFSRPSGGFSGSSGGSFPRPSGGGGFSRPSGGGSSSSGGGRSSSGGGGGRGRRP